MVQIKRLSKLLKKELLKKSILETFIVMLMVSGTENQGNSLMT